MKKLTLIIAAVAMGFIMASCGNKEKELMQKATEFYTQNETELKAVDNLKDFVNFFQNFEQKFNDFKGTFSDMELSAKTKNFLTEKENAFNVLKSQKADELLSPYLAPVEELLSMQDEFANIPEEEMTEEQLSKIDNWEKETEAKFKAWDLEFEEWNLDKNIIHDVLEKALPAETKERIKKIEEMINSFEEKPMTEEVAQ